MPSTRPLNLRNWGISWEEYKELSYFCLQYAAKKRDADALLTIRSTTAVPETYHVNGVEHGAFQPRGNATSDPTAATAARRERLLHDVRMIDQAVAAAGILDDGCDIRAALLRAVTTRAGVQAVMADPRRKPPCNKNEFYTARRKFFWILREMKNGDLEPIE